MRVDKDRLVNELWQTLCTLHSITNKNIISHDYDSFHLLNNLFALNYGLRIEETTEIPNIKKIIERRNEKTFAKFINYLNSSGNDINDISYNFVTHMQNIEFFSTPFWDVVRVYSEKEFKDIILGYYSTFGNNVYKIANRYFEENRIHTDTFFDDEYGGMFFALQCVESGYVFSIYDRYDTINASIIVHELGHAIDAHMLTIPQMKPILLFGDCLDEVPSTTFELGFCDYLNDNYIDRGGSKVLKNYRMNELYKYMLSINQILSKGRVNLKEDGTVLDDQNNPVDLRDSILYGLGYYFSLHLNYIKSKDNKEFMSRLNNLITLRNELSLEQMINEIGFSVEEFVSGKYINPIVENDFMELKKRYKLD